MPRGRLPFIAALLLSALLSTLLLALLAAAAPGPAERASDDAEQRAYLAARERSAAAPHSVERPADLRSTAGKADGNAWATGPAHLGTSRTGSGSGARKGSGHA